MQSVFRPAPLGAICLTVATVVQLVTGTEIETDLAGWLVAWLVIWAILS